MKKNLIIKTATEKDYDAMLKIINSTKVETSVLKKTKEQLRKFNYFVAIVNNVVIGTIGYKVWEKEKAEIISLVVAPEYRGKHIGTALVKYCIKILKEKGFQDFFVLTTSPHLFEKFNCQRVDINFFPEKIKCDCRKCPRNAGGPGSPLCNEVALYKSF